MEEKPLSLDQIKQKAVHGAISLTFQRFVFLIITPIITNVFLARILPQSIIGTFNLATTIVGFFTFFSDIGFAASLIQKKEIKEDDLTTVFTIQEILVTFIAILIFVSAPFFARFYRLDPGGDTLIRALAISFLIVSFKVIPSAILERNLNFKPLVIVDILEAAVFNILLIFLVINGMGLVGYAIAQVLRSIIGVVVLYNFAPWKVKFKYVSKSARQILNFGIPYQINSFLALLKDQLVPLIVGRMITPTEIGYVTMAQFLAFIPLQVMNIVIRVTFPAYSRLQHDREVLGKAIDRSLYVMGLVLYPGIFGILALTPNLVSVVGTQKWGPIIPLVYLFSFATFWASISTTFTNVFNAVGEIKLTFRLMIMWTALEWLLTPVMVWQFGFQGVAIASAIISFSSIATIIIMKQIIDVHIIANIGKAVVASAIMAIVLFPLAKVFLVSKIALIPLALVGGIIYLSILYFWDKKRLLREMSEVFHAIR